MHWMHQLGRGAGQPAGAVGVSIGCSLHVEGGRLGAQGLEPLAGGSPPIWAASLGLKWNALCCAHGRPSAPHGVDGLGHLAHLSPHCIPATPDRCGSTGRASTCSSWRTTWCWSCLPQSQRPVARHPAKGTRRPWRRLTRWVAASQPMLSLPVLDKTGCAGGGEQHNPLWLLVCRNGKEHVPKGLPGGGTQLKAWAA